MELTPRLQDIISILKEKGGSVNIRDLALQLKISPKTAKGYARELYRLGYIEMDENENMILKRENPENITDLKKTVETHTAEIEALKKEVEFLKEELSRFRGTKKVKV
ncbi:winged helix-turn-helix transcriptional regulator [Sulfolobus acidocaldarius]|uniref:Conserved protein n=4 Tax=Sulfolobus acidocaldarius TaxID=2285 RepID=Q4JA12_SULAC|nr:winged helix-turn-helix transcriptional regulator [Sulfolobus acidocaldarius]AHC51337.1 regulatory protein DeoR [Sulfolobus acidocaldarius SUSAZ]AAY80369.1 conserved protein [Sulfolobus acidocaldarius DSM 639]AGE70952.1 hypothetical protein SacN8_04905 [Sulfolobus acidocaldarius N8]AGE73223.1 hypothetical protein SacRon12I_04895 [Sulfolobus acidocaldarius Ron12/I]ALU28743.1 hypothetical protein ATY89_01400 [Sulfolobus acidocaldarius]